MSYVRKPMTVEAVLWNGFDGVFEIIEEMVHPTPIARQGMDDLAIHYMTGTVLANIGDYVLKNDEGAIEVKKPEVFMAIYDEIEHIEPEEEE